MNISLGEMRHSNSLEKYNHESVTTTSSSPSTRFLANLTQLNESTATMSLLQQLMFCFTLLLSLISTCSAQSSTFATAVTTGASTSQTLTPPTCAKACIIKATSVQSCAPADQACLCSASTQIQDSVAQCLTMTTCSDSDKSAAINYYPDYCHSLHLAVETNIPTNTAAGGSTPANTAASVNDPSSTIHSGAAQTTTVGPESGNSDAHKGLALPAVLGITLAALVVAIIFAAFLLWSILHRRQLRARRGPRMDLGGELAESLSRPARSRSVNSQFMVQPSPIEKDEFGPTLSRSSTLVPPPPIAKDDKRSSEQKRNSARNKALNLLLGNDRLRGSFLSGRSSSKHKSLVVPPLNITKQQEEELRISKF